MKLPLLANVNKEELATLYWDKKMSLIKIAKLYSVCPETVRQKFLEYNISVRPLGGASKGIGKLKGVTREQLYNLYWKEGLSPKFIGQQYGVTKSTVTKRMHELRIPFREKSVALRGEYRPHIGWKRGRRKSDGYIDILVREDNPFYSMANKHGYIPEHRLVMAQHLGRPLLRTEVVHHRPDVAKDDNRIEVLYLMPNPSDHNRLNPCFNCELKKEIRLLRWQIKEQSEQIRNLTAKVMGVEL